MGKGRKYGCPVSVRDWLIEVLNKATSAYVRINGLATMKRSIDGDTEEGAEDSASWKEPYITQRSGSISLEGKPVVTEATGAKDAGQSLLSDYALATGCDGDATLRLTDPYGHQMVADFIVTSMSDDAENSVTWEMDMVGEPEFPQYVQVATVAFDDNAAAPVPITTLALEVGDPAELVGVAISPATASNKRFKVTNSDKGIISVKVIDDTISITPVAAGTASVTVTTINGSKTATLAVTVTTPA